MGDVLVDSPLGLQDAADDADWGHQAEDAQRVDHNDRNEERKDYVLRPIDLYLAIDLHLLSTFYIDGGQKHRILAQCSKVTLIIPQWISIRLHLKNGVNSFSNLRFCTHIEAISDGAWCFIRSECAILEDCQGRLTRIITVEVRYFLGIECIVHSCELCGEGIYIILKFVNCVVVSAE